jgi:hypothetical protein
VDKRIRQFFFEVVASYDHATKVAGHPVDYRPNVAVHSDIVAAMRLALDPCSESDAGAKP